MLGSFYDESWFETFHPIGQVAINPWSQPSSWHCPYTSREVWRGGAEDLLKIEWRCGATLAHSIACSVTWVSTLPPVNGHGVVMNVTSMA
jgi:hypothetical protein